MPNLSLRKKLVYIKDHKYSWKEVLWVNDIENNNTFNLQGFQILRMSDTEFKSAMYEMFWIKDKNLKENQVATDY